MDMNLIGQSKARDCGVEDSEDWRCNFVHATHFCTFKVD